MYRLKTRVKNLLAAFLFIITTQYCIYDGVGFWLPFLAFVAFKASEVTKNWFESTLICQGLLLLKLVLEQGMPHVKLVLSRSEHFNHIVENLIEATKKSRSLGSSLQGTDFRRH